MSAVVKTFPLVALLGVLALPAVSFGQTRSPWLPPPALEASYLPPPPPPPPPPFALPSLFGRPLSMPAGMVALQWGAAYARSDIVPGSFRSTSGVGVSFDLVAGLGKRLELDFGMGVRLGELIAADRYGRVFRDDVFQTGNRFVGNPWLKLRYSFLDPDRAFGVGVEVMVQAPLAQNSAWSIGLGVPVLLTLPSSRWRVESGVFAQFVLSAGSTTRNIFNVPLRVLYGITDRFGVGVVTGIQAGNVFRADVSDANVQFGLVLRARVASAVELAAQWLLPAASPAGLDAYGVGLSVTHRVR